MSNKYEQYKNKLNQNIEERRENISKPQTNTKKSYGQLKFNPV